MSSDDKVFSQDSAFIRLCHTVIDLVEKPVIWFRENIAASNRPEYYWYHEKIPRVPTIDECYTDDVVCMYEAEEQYKLDNKVDFYILNILKKRYTYCLFTNEYDKEDCDSLKEVYEKALNNYFIKYGDLGFHSKAINCFMKQKNRMAWERRHGPVGSGRKPEGEEKMFKNSKAEC